MLYNLKERRVKFEKGKQREFIFFCAKRYGSLLCLSKQLKIPYSTLKNYALEHVLIPEYLFIKISKLIGKDISKMNVEYFSANWGMKLGGKKTMAMMKSLYPDKLSEWRKKASQSSAISRTKKIVYPELSEQLAEFIGAYIGDGTMTPYFIRIYGDYRYDQPYFSYLSDLIYNLFGVSSKISKDKRKNTCYLSIFSKSICDFLYKDFGLKFGDKIKNKIAIPNQIMSDPKLFFACLRGLIDTDGYVGRRGRNGEQFTLCFFSQNRVIIDQLISSSNFGDFFTYVSKMKNEVGTNSRDKILNFFSLVGSSNLRHITRFILHHKYNKRIYKKEVINYYQKSLYRDIKLPFKTGPVG